MKKRFLALALAVIMSLSFITVISTSAEESSHTCISYIPAGIEYYLNNSGYTDNSQLDTSEKYRLLLRYVTVNSNEFGNVDELGEEKGRDPFVFQRINGDNQRWYIAQRTKQSSESSNFCVPVFYNGDAVTYYVKVVKKSEDKYGIKVSDDKSFDGDGYVLNDQSITDGKFVEAIGSTGSTELSTPIFYSPLMFDAVYTYAKADLENEYGTYFDEELFSVSWKYENNYFSNSVEKLLFGVINFEEENWGLGGQSTLEDHRYTGNENHSTPYYLTAVEGKFTTQSLYPSVSCLFTFYEQATVEINSDNYTEHCDFVECEEHEGKHIIRCKYCGKTLREEACDDKFTLTTTLFGTEVKKGADGYCDLCGAVVTEDAVADVVSVNLISHTFFTSKIAKYFGATEKTYFLYKIKVDTTGVVGHNDKVAVVMYSFDGLTWKSGNFFITSEAKDTFWIKLYYTDDDIVFYECKTNYKNEGTTTYSKVIVTEVENSNLSD